MRWLHLLSNLGLGACLADDMGLGKTMQVLALLLILRKTSDASGAGRWGPASEAAGSGGGAPRLKEDKTRRASLLVAPASLLANWTAEIERFAPGLRVHLHHGADRLHGEELVAACRASDVVVFAAAAGVAFLVGWLATSQSLAGIAGYVRGAYEVVSGYNASMGRPLTADRQWQPLAVGLAWAVVLGGAVLASRSWPRARRLGLLAVLAAVLVIQWKLVVRPFPTYVAAMGVGALIPFLRPAADGDAADAHAGATGEPVVTSGMMATIEVIR